MRNCKLFVGNFNHSVTNEDLEKLFAAYGEVKEIKMIEDKGFGFVEMSSSSEAEKAKKALDRTVFKGRTLNVD
jgi:RNA recognition motif-containing protein